jgi:ATP-dependent exoDNAse (exonuclease V) beta subunit
LIEAQNKILYSTISSKSKIPEIANFSEKEVSLTLLDKMNLCYVALTRPVERLYGFNYYKKGRLGELMHSKLIEHFNCNTNDSGELVMESGAEIKIQKSDKEINELFYFPTEIGNRLWFPDVVFRKNYNLNQIEELKEQRFGNYFHLLMSECDNKEKLELKMNELIQLGKIDPEFSMPLKKQALAFFESAKFLYEDVIEIINEELILVPMEISKRPDKILIKEKELIVIEFKTGKQNKQHELQISGYQLALSEMYGKPILVYLYYSETAELVRIG